MGDSLTIVTPGGIAMASEEVFALIDTLTRSSSQLNETAWRVRSCSYGVSEVSGALRALEEARYSCQGLVELLHRLASEVATQEGWREATITRSRDVLAYLAVSAARWPRGADRVTKQRTGPQAEAITDNTAALLLGDYAAPAAVTVTEVSRETEVVGAQSMAERIARIPETTTPIRIERFELAGGETHTEVYISGTDEWSVGTGDSPFDMESNLAVVAGMGAASVLATTQAMRLAGVRPGDSVSFVGHSQGGAVALTLAESGLYSTKSVVTVGSPTGTLPVRGDYPALVIEHTNDVVPGLAGQRLNTNATIVRVDSGHGSLNIVGAHSREGYLETAGRIDASHAPQLSHTIPVVSRELKGTVHLFRASRLPDPPRLG